jgi:hypothetical protein
MKRKMCIAFLVCAVAALSARAQGVAGGPAVPPDGPGGLRASGQDRNDDRNAGLSGIPVSHFLHVPHFEPAEPRFSGGTSDFARNFEASNAARSSSWMRTVGEGGSGWLKGLLAALGGSAAAAGGVAARRRE